MELVAFWFIGAVVVGVIAASKGRTGFGWFVLSVLLSPLLIGILVLALPATTPAIVSIGEQISPATHVRCPECRELVRWDARKCKHCGIALSPLAAPPT
jgi:hypothetical protein